MTLTKARSSEAPLSETALQIAAAQAVAPLMAVTVGGEPALGQPLQELGRLGWPRRWMRLVSWTNVGSVSRVRVR